MSYYNEEEDNGASLVLVLIVLFGLFSWQVWSKSIYYSEDRFDFWFWVSLPAFWGILGLAFEAASRDSEQPTRPYTDHGFQ